jgi:hexulose-6-phosphate isomerase
VRRAIDESGLVVHGVVDSTHWRTTLSHPDEAVRAQAVEDLKTAIRASKAYGGTSVLLVPGVVGEDATYQQAWQRSIPEINKALPLAEDEGIHVLIENVWNNFLTDAKETARYLDELDSKMVGAYFDVGNAVRYAPPVEWIETLGERIVKLDIKEFSNAKARAAGEPFAGFEVELLEGECDWPAVMDEMEKIAAWTGWGTAEIPGGGKERLAEIARRMDRIYAS